MLCFSRCIALHFQPLQLICLTDRWLIFKKTELDRLINSVCFQVRSIKKAWHGKYSVKVHSGKYSSWYMKTTWKIQYKFADSKINWLMGLYYSSKFTHYYTYNILYRFVLWLFSAINPRGVYSGFVGEELRVDFLEQFALVLLN